MFIPFHFVKSPGNKLTSIATDPHAKIPEFKVGAVKVEALVPGDVDCECYDVVSI
ncbi:hypothetical protein L4C54_15975 [Vibrio lamellibrachiae]